MKYYSLYRVKFSVQSAPSKNNPMFLPSNEFFFPLAFSTTAAFPLAGVKVDATGNENILYLIYNKYN